MFYLPKTECSILSVFNHIIYMRYSISIANTWIKILNMMHIYIHIYMHIFIWTLVRIENNEAKIKLTIYLKWFKMVEICLQQSVEREI